jgi:hypothetical protein
VGLHVTTRWLQLMTFWKNAKAIRVTSSKRSRSTSRDIIVITYHVGPALRKGEFPSTPLYKPSWGTPSKIYHSKRGLSLSLIHPHSFSSTSLLTVSNKLFKFQFFFLNYILIFSFCVFFSHYLYLINTLFFIFFKLAEV